MVKSESDFQAHVAAFPGRRCGWNPQACAFAERGSFDAFFGVGTCEFRCPIWTPALCETTALPLHLPDGSLFLVYCPEAGGCCGVEGCCLKELEACPAGAGACSC